MRAAPFPSPCSHFVSTFFFSPLGSVFQTSRARRTSPAGRKSVFSRALYSQLCRQQPGPLTSGAVPAQQTSPPRALKAVKKGEQRADKGTFERSDASERRVYGSQTCAGLLRLHPIISWAQQNDSVVCQWRRGGDAPSPAPEEHQPVGPESKRDSELESTLGAGALRGLATSERRPDWRAEPWTSLSPRRCPVSRSRRETQTRFRFSSDKERRSTARLSSLCCQRGGWGGAKVNNALTCWHPGNHAGAWYFITSPLFSWIRSPGGCQTALRTTPPTPNSFSFLP